VHAPVDSIRGSGTPQTAVPGYVPIIADRLGGIRPAEGSWRATHRGARRAIGSARGGRQRRASALTLAIDVVIPTYDRWELTRSCLENLRLQTIPHNVIVVDNGSSDRTPARVYEAFPEVRVVELPVNVGFSAACNRGVAEGDGEVVLLLNNDVSCRPDFLERLVGPLHADERVGSASALLLGPGEETIESFGLAVDPTLAGYPRLRDLAARNVQTSKPVLVGPVGAAGAYRRRAWEAVGGLDENVFSYGEDVDLALRLRAAGWLTAGVPDAVALHVGSATAGSRSAWQRYQGGFARGYFIRRNGVLKSRYALRATFTEAIVVVGDALIFSHDLAALRGRVAGWRAARGLPRKPRAPSDAIDYDITLVKSLRLRYGVYTDSAGSCT
jgi:N-acetylglucosaminyl-diphospho-decaprenol L-rhamnosyltransferase